MQKFSRSRAKDPIQEKLRQSKDAWNKQTSNFIGNLIDFKKAINGKEVPQKNLPKVPIKEPFPSEITSFLSELSSNALKIIQEAEHIISEQEQYSNIKNNKQASSKEEEIIKLSEMVSEAAIFGQSWVGSRLWSKIKMMLSDEKNFSTDILDGCKELIDKLKALEDSCLSATETSGAPEVFTNMQSCLHIFNNRVIENTLKIKNYQNANMIPVESSSLEEEEEEDDGKKEKQKELSKLKKNKSEEESSSSEELELNKNQNKVSILDVILARESFFIQILEKEFEYSQNAYYIFTKIYNDPMDIKAADDKNRPFQTAAQKEDTDKLYKKIIKFKEDPSGIIFDQSDLKLIDDLYSKYQELIAFYVRKIFLPSEKAKLSKDKPITFDIIVDKLQKIEESVEEDQNDLMITNADSVSDLKNFLRKQWLNLKLDLKSSSSTEKYNKDIINLSKNIRIQLNKLMVLIEDASVNINLENIKNLVSAKGFKSNFPTSQAISYIDSISSAMFDMANISITYADLYRKIIRREEFKGSRYYRDISNSDIKETKLLISQMVNLTSQFNK